VAAFEGLNKFKMAAVAMVTDVVVVPIKFHQFLFGE
jgi:hypothetical protein